MDGRKCWRKVSVITEVSQIAPSQAEDAPLFHQVHHIIYQLSFLALSKCNTFANIPNHKLLQAQATVHRIRENPVFHLLSSLLRLKPEKGFYPALDIERLYHILTTKQSLAMINPGLAGGQEEMPETIRKSDKEGGGDRRQEHLRRQRREKEEQDRRLREEERENDKPIIDLTAEVQRFDEPRLKLLLDFFAEHFLKMAERSAKHKTHGQSYMYLRSAENLTTLMEEMGYHCGALREQVILPAPPYLEHLQVMKLRESVNYSLYIRDYWLTSYGHPQLDKSNPQLTRQQSMILPSLPRTPSVPSDNRQGKVVRMEVAADVHETDSEASSKKINKKKKKQSVKLDNFDFSESSDFGSEFTHL